MLGHKMTSFVTVAICLIASNRGCSTEFVEKASVMSSKHMINGTSSRYIDAPNLLIKIGQVSLAYRDLGPRDGIPVILLNHWGATLDNFDPLIVDALATKHRVITVDYRGIGKSTGTLPIRVDGYSNDIIAFAHALGSKQIDLFGFSLGGFVAQDITLKEPTLVRKLILTGTGPAGTYRSSTLLCTWLIFKSVFTFRDPKYYLFFPSTTDGNRAARAFLKRLNERKANRDKTSRLIHYFRQLLAIRAWEKQKPQALSKITAPTLVANGDNDLMVPSLQSEILASRIQGAKLIIYKASGHGGIFHYSKDFSKSLLEFLSDEKV